MSAAMLNANARKGSTVMKMIRFRPTGVHLRP